MPLTVTVLWVAGTVEVVVLECSILPLIVFSLAVVLSIGLTVLMPIPDFAHVLTEVEATYV